METVQKFDGVMRREIEAQLLDASYEVAPMMNETERVEFLLEMMTTLSPDDMLAML